MTMLLKCPRRLVVCLLAVSLLCMNSYAVETEEESGDPVTVIEDVIPEPDPEIPDSEVIEELAPEPEIPDDEVPEETIAETEPEFMDEDLIEEEAEEEPVIDEIPDDEVPEETIAETEPESMDEDLIEEEAEEDPVIDEIPDDLYQVYVLGFLLFFTIVIVFYFGYRFIAIFF